MLFGVIIIVSLSLIATTLPLSINENSNIARSGKSNSRLMMNIDEGEVKLASALAKQSNGQDFSIEDEQESTTKKSKKRKSKKRKPKESSEEEESEEDSEEEEIISDEGHNGGNKKPKKPKPGSKPKGKVIFEETFSERSWDSRWHYSKDKKFEKFYRIRTKRGQKGYDYGLVTSNKGNEDYAIAATFPAINSNDAPLIIQFSLQYQALPHCEHIYLRLFDCRFKAEDFNEESPFLIQFGPNICGTKTKDLTAIITDSVKAEKYVVNDKKVVPRTSIELHTYSFVIHPDGNYQILIKDKSVQNGSLTSIFPNYQGYTSICAVGLNIWHSILDKFFKGQIIIDDILLTTDIGYAEKKRNAILQINSDNNSDK